MSNSEPGHKIQTETSVYQNAAGEELGLLEIIAIFKRNFLLMFGIVSVVTLAAIFIIFLLPKVYRAEVIINPPLVKDVEQLNIFDIGLRSSNTSDNFFFEITEEKVYDKFIRFLNSKQLQLNFFKANNLYAHLNGKGGEDVNELEVFQKEFSDNIKLEDLRYTNRNDLETIFISLEGRDEKLIVEWMNKYVAYVDEYTVKSITDGINQKAQLQVKGLQEQIASMREVEKSRRLDMIEQYKEAAVIAETIGLTDQVSISLAPYDKLVEKMGFKMSPGDVPLYLRGSNALRAELKILQQRKNDDPFIPELRDLQQRMTFFENLKIVSAEIHAANIDQFAHVTNKPVKPKRLLLLVVGVVLGCLLAVFAALFNNLINRQKMEKKNMPTN